MSCSGLRFAVGMLALAAAANSCIAWDDVKLAYCAAHVGQGDCPPDAGPDAGVDGGLATFDGGPPVTWAIVRGGVFDDDFRDLAVDPAGTQFALSGHFLGAIDFGNGGNVSAGAPSANAMFVAAYWTSDAGLVDGNGFRCSSSSLRQEIPLVYVDAGLVLGATCFGTPAVVLDRFGAVLPLDGGLATQDTNPFIFRLGSSGPTLQYLNTPRSYTPQKRIIGLASAGPSDFLLAVNAPDGTAFLGEADAGDGGSNPLLARIGGGDFIPQQVDRFGCGATPVVQWESVSTDGSGSAVFAVIDSAPNPGTDNCSVVIPGSFAGLSGGSGNPGLHRHLFVLSAAGSGFTTYRTLGDVPPDGGILRLFADGPNSLYFAGPTTGDIENYSYGQRRALVVGTMDVVSGSVISMREFRAGPSSEVSINDVAMIPGVSPKIWVVGTVKGELQEADGGFVLASNEPTVSDGFLLRLAAGTFAPATKVVFGNPGFAEEGLRLVLRPPDLYVGGTVTPVAGNSTPYVFGGQAAPLIGGRDLLIFRMPIPP